MGSSFQDLLEVFVGLGGIAENICLREGEFGRGVFPVDSSRRTKIVSPKNLFVDSHNLRVSGDEIYIKDSSRLSLDERRFIESNYNHAWQGGGSLGASEFLRYVLEMPEIVKSQLLACGFIDTPMLNGCLDESAILKRFIDERVVGFGGKSVLASVWDLVNHSSFAPPLRITSHGVETPPIEPGSGEVLHRYSEKNSPISMWKKYGFACDCIIAYSIPFNINLGAQSVRCAGQLGLGPKEKASFCVIGETLSIKSLSVGCLSVGLPRQNFKSILSSVGLPGEVADLLFPKICEVNLKARHVLVDLIGEPATRAQSQLYKALKYEIKLIEDSLTDLRLG